MATWVYDGSFNGFLCLLFESARAGEQPEAIGHAGSGQPFLWPPKEARTDERLAKQTGDVLRRRLSAPVFTWGYYAFLSALKEREMAVYTYYNLAWTLGKSVDRLLTDPRVLPVHEASRAVLRERHRFLGFLRFTEIGGVLYAPFEPEADLLQLLAGHFSTRLGNEKWIIHDLGRGKAAIYAPRLWRIADFSLPEGIAPSRREEAFRDLWKEYFHSIAVRSRENPRLQRQFMPKKYWKHLPEKEPPAE